jgi:signal transduction histidine kinase
MKIFFIFILLILSIPYQANAYEHKIVIDYIKINNIKLSDDSNDIVISSKDSISFFYHCDAGNSEKSPFLFKVKIKYNGMENVRNINDNILTYSGLNEGQYDLSIGAFSNTWISNPIEIRFDVNDKLSALKNEIKQLKKEIKSKDTLSPQLTLINLGEKGYDIYSILIGFSFAVIFTFIILLIIKLINYKKQKNTGLKDIIGETMEKNKELLKSKKSFEKLTSEIDKLVAEVSNLRGQINSLQNRSEELNKKNQELKETIDRLMLSRKEFEELQRQKEELFTIIIHDLKNPVSLVKSLVDLLRSYDLSVADQQEIINDIYETTSRIVALSQEVTRILVLESSTLIMNYEYVQINDIIKDVYKRNLMTAHNKLIEILLDLDEKLPKSQVDPQKIDEVFDNLLTNAIKFSNEKGQIRIKSQKSKDSIVVEISDNGQGLSEDDVMKAFQRGGRLSAQPTAGESSSGFGLWIVKRLVDVHRGRVWVKSVLGKGSTFACSFPIFKPDNFDEQGIPK